MLGPDAQRVWLWDRREMDFSMVLDMASDRMAVDALRKVNRLLLPAAERQHFRDTSSPLQKT